MQKFSTLAATRITCELGSRGSDLKGLAWIPGLKKNFFQGFQLILQEARFKNYYSSTICWRKTLVRLLLCRVILCLQSS